MLNLFIILCVYHILRVKYIEVRIMTTKRQYIKYTLRIHKYTIYIVAAVLNH